MLHQRKLDFDAVRHRQPGCRLASTETAAIVIFEPCLVTAFMCYPDVRRAHSAINRLRARLPKR